MISAHKNSIVSVYISKQNVGICQFNQELGQIKCGQHSCMTHFTFGVINRIFQQQLKPDIIATNNDRHVLIQGLAESKQIVKIDERGLQDEVICNNLNLLRINVATNCVASKESYIKMMTSEGYRVSLGNQKFKALGMLIYYLLNEGNFNINNKVYLNDIGYFSDQIFKTVQMSSVEYQALQIMKEDINPSIIKGKGRSKQGFSVLSLYQTTLITNGAKKLLKNIFLNPVYNIVQLEQRLDIQAWIRSNLNDYQSLRKIFRGVHSADHIIKKFQQNKAQGQDWRKLVRTLESMLILSKIVNERIRKCQITNEKCPSIFVSFVQEMDWSQIGSVLSIISSTLDLNMNTVNKGIDATLDNLKKIQDNMPHLLTVYAQRQKWDMDFRIVFMAQVGYLIRVPHDIEIGDNYGGDEWVLQFVKNSGKFYCNSLTKMLDEQYGDVYGEITDRQKRIYRDLQTMVVQSSTLIEQCYWRTCQIQCWTGIAQISRGVCRPRYSSQSLIICGGWHLLLAQDAIDNNGFSFNHSYGPVHKVYNSEQNLVNTNYSNRMMVISGPNGSGKSIYMKQTAIIVYLAHIGFYVPAELAQIPIIDKIVMVEAENSIYNQEINGFQAEMVSLSRLTTQGMLTNKSLVLIDELGACIDSEIAQKLLAATISYLSDNKKGHICCNEEVQQMIGKHRRYEQHKFNVPLCIIVTHLTDIMNSKLIVQNEWIRFLTMDMQRQEISSFKIKPGLVKKGYGIQCAKSYMNAQIIKNAYRYWNNLVQDPS